MKSRKRRLKFRAIRRSVSPRHLRQIRTGNTIRQGTERTPAVDSRGINIKNATFLLVAFLLFLYPTKLQTSQSVVFIL